MADRESNDREESLPELPPPEYGSLYVSHTFRLQWKVPSKAFTDRNHVPQPIPKDLESFYLHSVSLSVVECSPQFEFKDLKTGPFCLALISWSLDNDFILKIITKPGSSLKLEYAFVCIDDRPFYLILSSKSPPDYLKDRKLSYRSVQEAIIKKKEKDVTITCGVSGQSCFDFYPPEEVSSESSARIRSCSYSPNIPPVPSWTSWSTSTSSNGSEAFVKYVIEGRLPSLDVELAKDLLRVSSEYKNSELNTLCVEYLVKNLNARNVAGVLRAACDLDAKDLMRKCNDFIEVHCYIRDRKDKEE